MNIEQQELVEFKQEVSKQYNAAGALVIGSDDDVKKASDLLTSIKNMGKAIKERKERITKPIMEALDSARELFKPLEAAHLDAERLIKSKILTYQAEVEKARQEAARKLEARVQAGTIKPETAVRKLEALPTTQSSAAGSIGKIATRTVRKVRIVDEALIPREYLVVNTVKLNEAVLRQGITVPGAEVYEEKVISSSNL